MIEAGGVRLCAESFGGAGDPPVLLIMGLGASMLGWEEGFCEALAGAGRFVVRYDHRDTGRSSTYEPGRPGYTGADLAADALRVLDFYAIPAAHLVGVSAGGGFAQMLALDHPERVRSLVLLSTSPATPGERSLPPPTAEFMRFLGAARVDWTEPHSVAEHLLSYSRVLAGGARPFDEDAARELVRAEVERAQDVAAMRNHDLIADRDDPSGDLGDIAAPTLVIHGTADPMFPLAHGRALADEIPGARLVTVEGMGHGMLPRDWDFVAAAIAEHTEAVC